MQKKFIVLFLSLLMSAGFFRVCAQESVSEDASDTGGVMVLPPLFEYPTVPEGITSWSEGSDWLVEHFWDSFDFKQKGVGQIQLNHAFKTYCVPMQFAKRDVTMKSIKKLFDSLNKNPTLLVQFTKSAERVIYKPETSEVLIDEVYVEFLRNLLKNKKVPEIYKSKYEPQFKALSNTLIGNPMPRFNFWDRHGVKTEYSPEAIYTIIEFGDPDCVECSMNRIRLETDTFLQQLAKDGKLRILFISPDVAPEDMEHWRESVMDYPHYWTVGASEDLEEIVDLRRTPCIYILDNARNIVYKDATPETAHQFLEQQIN